MKKFLLIAVIVVALLSACHTENNVLNDSVLIGESPHWTATFDYSEETSNDINVTYKGPLQNKPQAVAYEFTTESPNTDTGSSTSASLHNNSFVINNACRSCYEESSITLTVTWNGQIETLVLKQPN